MMDRYSKTTVLKAADIIGSKNLLIEINTLVERNLPETDFIQKIKEFEQKKELKLTYINQITNVINLTDKSRF